MIAPSGRECRHAHPTRDSQPSGLSERTHHVEDDSWPGRLVEVQVMTSDDIEELSDLPFIQPTGFNS